MLSARALICSVDQLPLFQSVTFDLSAGQGLHIIGGNGSGKTTLLRTLATVLPVLSGQLLWHGKSLEQRVVQEAYLQQIVYVGHSEALYGASTIEENLRWYAAMRGYPLSRQKLQGALQRVGLSAMCGFPISALSRGQRCRTHLARLLIFPATLWLLDEPFASLDQHTVKMMEDCCCAHLQQGGMIIFSSHQQHRGILKVHEMVLIPAEIVD